MKKFFRRPKRPNNVASHSSGSTFATAPFSTGHTLALGPKFNVPPFPHPSPHSRIEILATSKGLLLRAVIPGISHVGSHIQISWGKAIEVSEVQENGDDDPISWSDAVTTNGVLGFLRLYTYSYMFVITSSSSVGSFLDQAHTVYEIKAVVAIPLEINRAKSALKHIASSAQAKNDSIVPDTVLKSSSTEIAGDNQLSSVDKKLPMSLKAEPSSERSTRSVSVDNLENLQKSAEEKIIDSNFISSANPDRLDDILTDEPSKLPNDIQHLELESRIVKECLREFTKSTMYFSYNFDITTSLQHKQQLISEIKRQHSTSSIISDGSTYDEEKMDLLAEPNYWLPLWRRVNRRFWWNEWMLQPLIEAGLHSYILPVMQGFYQVSSFHISDDSSEGENRIAVDYAVISRRSRDRAGLRYQRRGVDDEANVANFVESETLMRVERDKTQNVFAYVQIRGSVPLFWTQSGYGLKPPPQLSTDRDHEQNLAAIGKHLEKVVSLYGPNVLVNLMEHHGKEAPLSHAYKDYVTELSAKDIKYCEYDFHAETKGMKYENIAGLVAQMESAFESQGFFWVSDGRILSRQKGVFRVNCADCLDRTNVVQSAFARHALTTQLSAVALLNKQGQKRTEMEVVFNNLWANNGDAISRAYAGTSALKGDFTRTGKRDLGGLINDGINSLARMYSSTFSDWFSQAVIDFMLGNRTLSVFSEFLSKLQSTDPRERIRLSKIRAEAIATVVSRVLPEGERLLSGWTLLSPPQLNVRLSEKLEEKILLLTAAALYIVRYDYQLEIVAQYTRVPLENIGSITKGAYIISPLEESSRDVLQNYGFMVSFITAGQMTRLGNHSLHNTMSSLDMASLADGENDDIAVTLEKSTSRASPSTSTQTKSTQNEEGEVSFVALKALPVDPARGRRESRSYEEPSDDLSGVSSCREAVGVIVEAIRRACEEVGSVKEDFLKDSDIVSLDEAKHMTSIIAKMEYGIKRMLWLGS